MYKPSEHWCGSGEGLRFDLKSKIHLKKSIRQQNMTPTCFDRRKEMHTWRREDKKHRGIRKSRHNIQNGRNTMTLRGEKQSRKSSGESKPSAKCHRNSVNESKQSGALLWRGGGSAPVILNLSGRQAKYYCNRQSVCGPNHSTPLVVCCWLEEMRRGRPINACKGSLIIQ